MAADLTVALRVQAKLDDARKAVQSLKGDIVDLGQAGQQATTGMASGAAAPFDAATKSAREAAQAAQTVAATQEDLADAVDQVTSAEERRARALAQSAPSEEQERKAQEFKKKQAQAANDAGDATEKERQALDRLVAILDPAAGQAQQLATAQATLNAALDKGVISADQHARMMALVQQRYAGTRVSAAQTAAAMRMLPAQFTDIATSIVSGMPFWMVAIQQGGQIKDSFGGIGPALAAMRAAISPASLALGGLAAVGGLLVANMVAAERRALALAVAVQTTGNAAGATAGRIEAVAEQANRISGINERVAEDAAVAMVQAGRLGMPVIANLVTAVEGYARATKSSTDAAAANLAKLFVNPAQAAKQLDDQFNLLTAAERRHIALLVEQGRTEEAQLQLSQRLAEQFGTVLPRNLGVLQRAWEGVTGAIGGAFAAMLRWGQAPTIEKQIEAQKTAIANLESQIAAGGTRAALKLPAMLKAAQEQLATLQQQQATEAAKADEDSAKVSKDRRIKLLREQFDAETKTYQTGAEQLQKEKEKLDELLAAGPDGGGISQAEYDARLKAIRDRANKGTPAGDRAGQVAAARIKADLQILQAQIRDSDALVVQELERGRMSLNDAYARRVADINRDYDAQREALEKELTAPGMTSSRRIEIAAQIKVLEQSKAAASRDLDAWKRAEELKLVNLTIRLRVDTAAITGKFDRAAIEEQLRQQYAADLEVAGRNDDPEKAEAARQQVELLKQAAVAQAEFNNKLAEAQRLQAQLAVLEEAIQQRASTGAISQIEAQGLINQARAAQIPMLQAIAAELQRVRDALPADAKVTLDNMTTSIGSLQNQISAATPVIVDMGTRMRNTMIDGLADAGATAVANFHNLRDAAATTLKQIAADIVRSGIKKLLTDAFTPGSAGGGGGSLAGSIFSAVGSIFGFAQGGLIRGPGTGTSDSIPAVVHGSRPIRVANNEFIQPERAVNHYGVGFMESIRTLKFPRPSFAFGGLVRASQAIARYATGGSVAASSADAAPNVVVQFTNNGTPKRIASQSQELSGRDLVLAVVLEDIETGGPISRGLPTVFNRGGA